MKIKDISSESLKKILQEDTLLIDIREKDEFKNSHIKGSINIPSAYFTTDLLKSFSNKNIVLYCLSGKRSDMLSKTIEPLPNQSVYKLDGGIKAWMKSSDDVMSVAKKLSLMQQVQVAIGFIILIAYLLAFSVSSSFIYLPIFIGLGLIFAGLTGFCGLAKVLSFMPWNK